MRHGWVGIVAPLLAVTSMGAHALGLSDIAVDSRLNQPLVATLRLSTLSEDEADSLQVQLASAEEFEKAGLTLTDFVAGLRFAISGNLVRISSQQSAREPMLSLLVEARAGSSRVLRGYTVLLDLPAADVPASPEAAAGDRQYGPVKAGETFWSVATRLRPDPARVSMDQTLLALYTANPEAFFGGINGLLTGAVLRVPSLEQMRSVSEAEAHRQIAALRAGNTAATPARRPPPASKWVAVSPSPPPATAPVPAAAAPAPATEPPAVPAPATSAAPPAPVETTNVVAPPAVSAVPANEAPPATDAVVSPAAESPAQPVDATAVDPVVAGSDATTVVGDGVVATEPPVDEPVASAPVVEPAVAAAPAATPPKPVVDRKTAGSIWALMTAPFLLLALVVLWRRRHTQALAAPRVEPSGAAGVEPETSAADAVQTADSSDRIDDAATVGETLADSAADPIGADDAPANEFAAEVAPPNDQHVEFDEPADAVPTPSEQVLMDPDLPQGDGDIDLSADPATPATPSLDQLDPLAEAEFHLSYGLYDEAVRGLLDAIAGEPGRDDLAVKLAETYFAAGRPDDFEALAQQLQFRLSAADWSRLTFMGAQLCPDSALFRDPSQPLSTPQSLPPVSTLELEPEPAHRVDFSLGAPPAWSAPVTPPAEATPVATEHANRIDFSFGPTPVATGPTAAAGSMPALDLSNPQTIPVEELLALDPDDINLFEPEPESDLATDDEVGTKLDLARAYIDMGDTQMARDLLTEVAQQGTPTQQADAHLLLLRLPA